MKLLDEVYKTESATAMLEVNPLAIKFSKENAKTIYLQELTLEGLGDYSRATGYVSGDADLVWQAYTLTQDRGKSFPLDALDSNQAMLEVLQIAAAFQREKVIPEIDAYRFEKICTDCSLDVSADLTSATILAALDTAIAALDDAEVKEQDRVLMISHAAYALLKNCDDLINTRLISQPGGVINRNVAMFDEIPVIKVPKARFCNNFTFSATDGFTKTGGSKDLNFILADKNAIMAVNRYSNPKIIDPKYNPTADGWVYAYRVFHDLFVPTNKKPGVYISARSTTN